MKKVRVTIKREQTFDIEFNDKNLDDKFIEEWGKYMFDLKEPPEDAPYFYEDDTDEKDYPFLNLANAIAYQIAENDADNLEGLKFQDITPNEFNLNKKDPDISVHYKRIGYMDTEYEYDLQESILTNKP